MKYLSSAPFSVPVNPSRLSQIAWDRAVLTREEFITLYGFPPDVMEVPSAAPTQ